jgi:uncharacterized protein (TIGR03083 family)
VTGVYDAVAAERGALADDLSGLTDAQWRSPSLCAGWSVREVLAHMVAMASLRPWTFVLGMIAGRFDFHRVSERQIVKHLGATPAETLSAFRAVKSSRGGPPGPKVGSLVEVLIHAEDIRRPLGIAHVYPLEAVRQVADFVKGVDIGLGTKSRIDGLRLIATDADWCHGEGEEVAGPMLSLLMAMTGRSAASDDLAGSGVQKLRDGGT